MSVRPVVRLTIDQSQALAALQAAGSAGRTGTELGRQLGRHQTSAASQLAEIWKAGLATRSRRGRDVVYHATPAAGTARILIQMKRMPFDVVRTEAVREAALILIAEGIWPTLVALGVRVGCSASFTSKCRKRLIAEGRWPSTGRLTRPRHHDDEPSAQRRATIERRIAEARTQRRAER